MRQEAAISDIDKLKDWFMLCQTKDETKPYFTIYRGIETKPDRAIYRNSEISDVDDAWAAMEDILEMHSEYGGIFRIYITSKPGFNVGLSTLYKVSNPGIQQQGSGMAGIYGMYSNPRDLVAQEVARERKLWELEQEIKDMRRDQEAKVGEMDSMMQEFMPIVKDLAHRFGLKMMGMAPANNMPMSAPQINGNQAPEDPEGFNYDRIEPALDELRQVVPDVETSLEKLARWARQNPDTAKQMLQNL